MDVYSDNGYRNAAVSEQLVNNLVSDLDDAEEVVNAYLAWVSEELNAASGSITNNCGLTIDQTADGWDVDFTAVPNPGDGGNIKNTGLGDFGRALQTKFNTGYDITVTWPGQIQTDHSIDSFLAQWNDMATAVVAGNSFELTITVTENADITNTISFIVALG